jgi:uncharacterized membrane protein (UPF0127 family)
MRSLILGLLILLAGATASTALPVERIVIDTATGPQVFRMEIAADKASQERGLMFRKHMAANAGMLFDFHQPSMVGFWMKDTVLPLDMLFVRPDGTISTIAANAVPYSTNEIRSEESVRVVIEINGGRARALGITPGDLVHARAFGNVKRR